MSEERNVKNIVIIGANLPFVKEVSKTLADQLEMYYLDVHGLFEFDISPDTFADVLKRGGVKYFRNQQRGSVKYASSFENTVIAVELGVAESLDNIKILDKRGLLILLDSGFKATKSELKKLSFNSKKERKLFVVSRREFSRRVKNVKSQVDICIATDKFDVQTTIDEIKNKILEYYLQG